MYNMNFSIVLWCCRVCRSLFLPFSCQVARECDLAYRIHAHHANISNSFNILFIYFLLFHFHFTLSLSRPLFFARCCTKQICYEFTCDSLVLHFFLCSICRAIVLCFQFCCCSEVGKRVRGTRVRTFQSCFVVSVVVVVVIIVEPTMLASFFSAYSFIQYRLLDSYLMCYKDERGTQR